MEEEPLQNYLPHPHTNSRDSTSTENSFVVKPFPTVLKIRIFLTGSTPHVIGLYHAVNKFASCCKLTTGEGLGTGEHLKRE